MNKFSLEKHDYILLCDLLKVMSFYSSGGQAKLAIAEGKVKINGKIELRKKCKIRAGAIVDCLGRRVIVTE